MASLTLKGIPPAVLEQLRKVAQEERRSLNQQAILLLERALVTPRVSFAEAYPAFVKRAGPSPLETSDLENLRAQDDELDVVQ
ncbi:MAG: Arc family DNA-binding protein [Rhodothermales bacterium]|nr:Arc family DNA-binding protein [Rhodothermales bacterium]